MISQTYTYEAISPSVGGVAALRRQVWRRSALDEAVTIVECMNSAALDLDKAEN